MGLGRSRAFTLKGLLASAVPAVVLLWLPSVAIAAGNTKPAGGAAAGEVIGATAAAMVATGVLFALGIAHRTGRTQLLRKLGAYSERVSGMPAWASIPSAVAAVSLIIALFGMYWDISLHIDQGRDPGPLANPAHYFILVGLFGIFAAGFLSIVLPDGKPSPAAIRIAKDWYAPVGGVVFLACASFALLGFPLDDMWHRLFGQDVTLWGPTHLMMFGGAGLSLLGHATLAAEAGELEEPSVRGPLGYVIRTRRAAIFGGLLVGLSTFQGEFDFGVPQFQLIFQPMLIAAAAGIALVGARIYVGRGGALTAVAHFLVIRGVLALLVGPVLGEATPHLPLYLAEAALVELLALRIAVAERPYRFGAAAGLLIGTVGMAAEWGWSHLWMPIPWPSSLLGEALVLTPIAGVAGGVIGAFVGTALAVPGKPQLRVPAARPAAAALVAVAALVGFGLATDVPRGLSAQVSLRQTAPPPHRKATATVRLAPRDAADHAKWLTVTAWQGGGLVVNRLERVGEGTYRTTQPIPVYGDWKALVRLHRGNSILGVPIYLPSDPAIPVKGVSAPARLDRTFVADRSILQRERKRDVPSWLFTAGALLVLAIAVFLLAVIGWALTRVARASSRDVPPPRVREPARTGRALAPGGAA